MMTIDIDTVLEPISEIFHHPFCKQCRVESLQFLEWWNHHVGTKHHSIYERWAFQRLRDGENPNVQRKCAFARKIRMSFTVSLLPVLGPPLFSERTLLLLRLRRFAIVSFLRILSVPESLKCSTPFMHRMMFGSNKMVPQSTRARLSAITSSSSKLVYSLSRVSTGWCVITTFSTSIA